MTIENRKLHKRIKPVLQKKYSNIAHIVDDNEFQNMEDKKWETENKELNDIF